MPTIDDLLAAVHRLSQQHLDAFLDGLAGMQAVADAGWRVRERRFGHRRFAERDAEILRRHADGESYGQLALAYGLSRSGIVEACKRARELSVQLQTTCTAAAN